MKTKYFLALSGLDSSGKMENYGLQRDIVIILIFRVINIGRIATSFLI